MDASNCQNLRVVEPRAAQAKGCLFAALPLGPSDSKGCAGMPDDAQALVQEGWQNGAGTVAAGVTARTHGGSTEHRPGCRMVETR